MANELERRGFAVYNHRRPHMALGYLAHRDGKAPESRSEASRRSRKVADLEQRLNARLLQRTTRKLSLTDVGRTYFDHCARIVIEVEDAERTVTSWQHTPRGLFAARGPTLLSSRPSSATT